MSEQSLTSARSRTIFRIVKNQENPFVMIDRRKLENPSLSWSAKGLLAYLLSRPDNWEINMQDLIKRSTDGEYATRRALKELRNVGHIVFFGRLRAVGGKMGRAVWAIYEEPLPENQRPNTTCPRSDYPRVGNLALNNRESSNTKTSQATPVELFSSGKEPEQVSALPPNVVKVHINTPDAKLPADWKMAAGLPVEPKDFDISREQRMMVAASCMPAYMQDMALFISKMTNLIPESKRDLSRWRGDLKEIHEKHLTKDDMKAAYDKCIKEGLTVKSPASLTGIADALRAVAETKKATVAPVKVTELQRALEGGFTVAPKPTVFSQGD